MFTYQYRYNLDGTETYPKGAYEENTLLSATFLFKNEVAPINRDIVRARCQIKDLSKKVNSVPDKTTELDKFITQTLCYRNEESTILRGKQYSGQREIITITPLIWRLGLIVESHAKGKIELADMIDLAAIDYFVLTGKTKLRNQQA